MRPDPPHPLVAKDPQSALCELTGAAHQAVCSPLCARRLGTRESLCLGVFDGRDCNVSATTVFVSGDPSLAQAPGETSNAGPGPGSTASPFHAGHVHPAGPVPGAHTKAATALGPRWGHRPSRWRRLIATGWVTDACASSQVGTGQCRGSTWKGVGLSGPRPRPRGGGTGEGEREIPGTENREKHAHLEM